MTGSRWIWAVALATAVGVAGVVPAGAQDTPPDPAQAAADGARRAAEGAAPHISAAPTSQQQPRFVPGPGGAWQPCENEPPADQQLAATVPPGFAPQAGMNGGPGWLVSSPRGWPGPIRPGGIATLSLRDKYGTVTRLVSADVVAPDGTSARAASAIFGNNALDFAYPSDFTGASPLGAGVYTVIWRATTGDRFIACDGFVVTP